MISRFQALNFPFLLNIYRYSINTLFCTKLISMRKRSISILALVIALVITTYFFLIIWGSSTSVQTGGNGSSDIFPNSPGDTAFGDFSGLPALNDSLPHYLYQHLADSIKRGRDERNLENRSVGMNGESIGTLGIYVMDAPGKRNSGMEKMQRTIAILDSLTVEADKKIAMLTSKDSIAFIKKQLRDTLAYFNRVGNQPVEITNEEPGKLYYLGITGYSLAYEKKFFVQNGTYNLAIPKWDSVKKDGNGDSTRYGHYERRQIPVRYSTENKQLLIPVSFQQWKALKIILPVFNYCLLFAALYFFLGLPIQILVNISKGKAFDERNIKRFTLMTQVLLCWGVLNMLSPYILRLLFGKMIPDDFTLPGFWQMLNDNLGIFILVLAIFITGKAFQKGNRLQKEQDLTI